jgi:chromosome transmission fidelity protein 8
MIVPINIREPSPSAIKLPSHLAKLGSDEIVLLELQGSLQVESVSDSARDGQMVGKLHIDNSSVSPNSFPRTVILSHARQSKPTLTIGHHLLEGKIVNLSKPLAVLLRSGHNTTDADDHTMPHWDLVTVVKRKIVFSKRPMPVAGPVNSGIGVLAAGLKWQWHKLEGKYRDLYTSKVYIDEGA